MDEQIISQEGYDKLKQELDNLATVKRREIADRIQRAKDQGDLSENAEYNEAKDQQAFNEGRIAELSQMIKNLTVVETNGGSHGEVAMGTTLTATANGQERQFTIVSFNEADPLSGKISNESPLGRAFLGHRAGDTVKVVTPKGEVMYTIVNVG
jgi:transcription elongation factor GreA